MGHSSESSVHLLLNTDIEGDIAMGVAQPRGAQVKVIIWDRSSSFPFI